MTNATARVTLVDIGPRQTCVVTGYSSPSETTLNVAIGWASMATKFFKSEPPTGPELERAIDAVEGEIMRMGTRVPGGSEVLAAGEALRELMLAARQVDTDGPVTAAMVEEVFQRIASASLGHPTARQGLPDGNAFAATALIMREFMHHLGFAAVAAGR